MQPKQLADFQPALHWFRAVFGAQAGVSSRSPGAREPSSRGVVSSGRLRAHGRRLFGIVATLVRLGGGFGFLVSCGASGSRHGHGVPAPSPMVEQDSVPIAVEGLFDVGGHRLYLRCEGSGSPTVIYLHGLIVKRGGSQSSGLIPGYVRDRAQICIYDRTNVGFSDTVPGPLSGREAVNDLHRLLQVAHLRGPFVMLAGSFGGLIATMYAATYPEDVAGMVLLDASLADEVTDIDERFLPEHARLQPDDWKRNVERMDQLVTYRQAHEMPLSRTDIPLTFFATTRLELDPSWPVEQMTAAIRAEQRAFVSRFPLGRLLLLRDVPHFMERAIPRVVADEVVRVVVAARVR